MHPHRRRAAEHLQHGTCGPVSAALSNPATTPSWFEPGSQRGDKQNDGLIYVNFTITKNITFHHAGTKRLRYKQAKLRSKF